MAHSSPTHILQLGKKHHELLGSRHQIHAGLSLALYSICHHPRPPCQFSRPLNPVLPPVLVSIFEPAVSPKVDFYSTEKCMSDLFCSGSFRSPARPLLDLRRFHGLSNRGDFRWKIRLGSDRSSVTGASERINAQGKLVS